MTSSTPNPSLIKSKLDKFQKVKAQQMLFKQKEWKEGKKEFISSDLENLKKNFSGNRNPPKLLNLKVENTKIVIIELDLLKKPFTLLKRCLQQIIRVKITEPKNLPQRKRKMMTFTKWESCWEVKRRIQGY